MSDAPGHFRTAVYPGTFDPITYGHLDVIARATKLCDRLIIAVAANAGKGPLFTLEERVAMVKVEVADMADATAPIDVMSFDNLLMDFVADSGGSMIVRGLRAVSDFEYEFQMAGMNAHLNTEIETVFLMASEGSQFISSRFVKEIGRLGGEIQDFVPDRVKLQLLDKFKGGA